MAGTNPGTGAACLPTALAAVGPYALPVPGLIPGQRRWAEDSTVDEGGQGHETLGGCLQGYLAHKKQHPARTLQ